MRCTRCDRPASPQAVGRTTEGDLVFGWCTTCLELTGCIDVVIAPRRRRPSTRLVLKDAVPTPVRREPASPSDERRRVVSVVAGCLVGWGALLTAAGLAIRSRSATSPSPLGNGTPALFLGGGGSTTLVGLILWATCRARDRPVTRRGWRRVRVFGFAAALAILGLGILWKNPRRDPLIVLAASAALAVSAAATWAAGPPGENPRDQASRRRNQSSHS